MLSRSRQLVHICVCCRLHRQQLLIGASSDPLLTTAAGVRLLHRSTAVQCKGAEGGHAGTKLVPLTIFKEAEEKNKKTFLAAMDMFHEMTVHKRGHVEFIYAALKEMERFGVHKDLEAYKKVLGVFPVGQMVATNMYQVEFMHYPRQQNCAIDVLQQMEDNGVIPDLELRDQLINIFGKFSFPVRKFARMLYWMPKFKNLSPWLLPNPLPSDSLQLAQLAVAQIVSVDARAEVTTFLEEDLPEDALDLTWVVSGHSRQQTRLLEEHPKDQPLFVEGAFRIWLRDKPISYFILRADPKPERQHEGLDSDDITYLENWTWRAVRRSPAAGRPEDPGDPVWHRRPPSVHKQEDGTILAVCATGSSSRDSLLSWIRLLQRQCPRLAQLPVLFTLRSPLGDVAVADQSDAGDVTPDNR